MQVIQDLHEECGKYGQLHVVIVPRPPNPASAMELFGSNNYGKVGAGAAKPAWLVYSNRTRNWDASLVAVQML